MSLPRARASQNTEASKEMRFMLQWEITEIALLPCGSNYVFLTRLQPSPDSDETLLCIYKPAAGERPLQDFTYGTLHFRERAAFVLSQALGWPAIPPVIIRDGPHGTGSFQLFIDHDQSVNFFSLRDEDLKQFACIATFDVLVNNTDRKGGSILQDGQGKLWAIDHGLTFNYNCRIRTVMLEFGGSAYEHTLLKKVEETANSLEAGELEQELTELVGEDAVKGLLERAEEMVTGRRFPMFDPAFNVPYPFV